MLCPQTLFSLRERWTLICMRATALRQQALEVGRKALLSPSFTNGWTYDNTGDNSPIVFDFKDKKFLYMIYKEVKQGEFGKLHVKVTADGEVYDESDYDTISPSGWGNAQIQNIAMMPGSN